LVKSIKFFEIVLRVFALCSQNPQYEQYITHSVAEVRASRNRKVHVFRQVAKKHESTLYEVLQRS